jgi:hypothetical protein
MLCGVVNGTRRVVVVTPRAAHARIAATPAAPPHAPHRVPLRQQRAAALPPQRRPRSPVRLTLHRTHASIMESVVSAVRAAAAGDTAAAAAIASKVLGYAVVAGSSILKLPQASARVRRVRCACVRSRAARVCVLARTRGCKHGRGLHPC